MLQIYYILKGGSFVDDVVSGTALPGVLRQMTFSIRASQDASGII